MHHILVVASVHQRRKDAIAVVPTGRNWKIMRFKIISPSLVEDSRLLLPKINQVSGKFLAITERERPFQSLLTVKQIKEKKKKRKVFLTYKFRFLTFCVD